jgi:predicted SAM-dependent methyltransferase
VNGAHQMASNNQNLSFDRFSRHNTVATAINSLRAKNQKFKILDVGGYRGVTRDFHPNDEVTILDVEDVDDPGYVKGDGSGLHFPDNSFDFVVNFDVLEHIPQNKRESFINECWRVAKIGTFIATPVRTKPNEVAEEKLNSIHKQLYKQSHRWLHEHQQYVLPEKSIVERVFQDLGAHTLINGSNEIVMWTLLQAAVFLNARFTEGSKHIEDLNKIYNSLADSDEAVNSEDNYRIIFSSFKKQADMVAAEADIKKMSKFKPEDRILAANALSEHYIATLFEYTKLYESLYKEFTSKVGEKELLQRTINSLASEKASLQNQVAQLSSELESAKSDLNSLSNSKPQKIAKIANKILLRSR